MNLIKFEMIHFALALTRQNATQKSIRRGDGPLSYDGPNLGLAQFVFGLIKGPRIGPLAQLPISFSRYEPSSSRVGYFYCRSASFFATDESHSRRPPRATASTPIAPAATALRSHVTG